MKILKFEKIRGYRAFHVNCPARRKYVHHEKCLFCRWCKEYDWGEGYVICEYPA